VPIIVEDMLPKEVVLVLPTTQPFGGMRTSGISTNTQPSGHTLRSGPKVKDRNDRTKRL